MPHQQQQIEAPRGPNQGLDPAWVRQQQRAGDRAGDDLEGLRDVPAAIKQLATSVKEFPHQVSQELHLVQGAFWAGASVGFVICLVIAVGISLLRRRS